MTARIAIGNSLDGQHPAKATIRMVRAGHRNLSSYSYNTWNLQAIKPEWPASRHYTINEAERFFERDTDPRMSTGATMFAVMDKDEEHPDEYHTRPVSENVIEQFYDFRSWGENDDKNETIGLRFRVYREGDFDGGESEVYFDNSLVKVSNILWEFSPDGGESKWCQLYDLPNRAYSRVTLPDSTNRLRLRAISNNPDEWVQAIAVTPKTDYQYGGAIEFAWNEEEPELKVDGFGYMKWPKAIGGNGTPIYYIYSPTGYLLGKTRNTSWFVELGDEMQYGYRVVAKDAANHELELMTIAPEEPTPEEPEESTTE